jgi:hypothetical protein
MLSRRKNFHSNALVLFQNLRAIPFTLLRGRALVLRIEPRRCLKGHRRVSTLRASIPIASVLPANKPTTHSVERIDLEFGNHLFDLVSPSDKEEARQDKCRFAEKEATARRRSNATTGFYESAQEITVSENNPAKRLRVTTAT